MQAPTQHRGTVCSQCSPQREKRRRGHHASEHEKHPQLKSDPFRVIRSNWRPVSRRSVESVGRISERRVKRLLVPLRSLFTRTPLPSHSPLSRVLPLFLPCQRSSNVGQVSRFGATSCWQVATLTDVRMTVGSTKPKGRSTVPVPSSAAAGGVGAADPLCSLFVGSLARSLARSSGRSLRLFELI